MSESLLRIRSMDFAVSIINIVKYLKEKRETIISNQCVPLRFDDIPQQFADDI